MLVVPMATLLMHTHERCAGMDCTILLQKEGMDEDGGFERQVVLGSASSDEDQGGGSEGSSFDSEEEREEVVGDWLPKSLQQQGRKRDRQAEEDEEDSGENSGLWGVSSRVRIPCLPLSTVRWHFCLCANKSRRSTAGGGSPPSHGAPTKKRPKKKQSHSKAASKAASSSKKALSLAEQEKMALALLEGGVL